MTVAQIETLGGDASIDEAAAFLGCKRRKIERLIAERRLQSFKLGEQRRITLESLRALRREMLEREKEYQSAE